MKLLLVVCIILAGCVSSTRHVYKSEPPEISCELMLQEMPMLNPGHTP